MRKRELVRYRGLVYDSARWEGFELRLALAPMLLAGAIGLFGTAPERLGAR